MLDPRPKSKPPQPFVFKQRIPDVGSVRGGPDGARGDGIKASRIPCRARRPGQGAGPLQVRPDWTHDFDSTHDPFLPPLGTHFLAGVLTHAIWPITCVNTERSKPVGRRAAGQQSIQVISCSRAFSGRSQTREACRHHRWPVAPPRLSPRLMLSLTTRAPLARWANINCPPTLDPPSTLPLSVKRDALYAGRLVSGIHSPWSK
jgi:hypothetical protein